MKLYEIQRKRIDVGKVEVGFGTTETGTFLKFPHSFYHQNTGEKVSFAKVGHHTITSGLCFYEHKHRSFEYSELSYDELFEALPTLFVKDDHPKKRPSYSIALCMLEGVVASPKFGGLNRHREEGILIEEERFIRMVMLYDESLGHAPFHRHLEHYTFPFGLVVKGGVDEDGTIDGVVEGLRTLYHARAFGDVKLQIYEVKEIVVLR